MVKHPRKRRMVCRVLTVSAALCVFCSTAVLADEQALSDLEIQLRKELPDGWRLSTTRSHWILRRVTPVACYNSVSLPALASEEELKEYVKDDLYDVDYMIVLRFGPKVTPMQYEQWQAENRRARKRQDELVQSVRDIPHKFDQYLPQNVEEERRVAAYKAAVAQIRWRQLPERFHRNHSIYIETTHNWFDAFFDDDVGAECRSAWKLVRSKFKSYAN